MMKLTSELAEGLKDGHPAVALESTLICHGIPKPRNGELALEMETRVREKRCLAGNHGGDRWRGAGWPLIGRARHACRCR